MPDWGIWLIAAALLAAGEVAAQFTFILGPVALAALVPAAAAAVGAPVEVQIILFIIASIASLLLVRPIAKRHMTTPARIRTGTAALIGTRALVLDRVDSDHGQVKIGGEVWTARPYDEDDVYEPGARVEVVKIEGATALVQE
jgi:membrane protein implicated in regulation of membrane protease activity